MIRRRPYAVVRERKTPQQVQQAVRRRREMTAHLFGLNAIDEAGRLRQPAVAASAAVVTIRLPHRLPSLNEVNGHHWSRKARVKDAWLHRLRYAVDLVAPRRALVPHLFPSLASRLDWAVPTTRPLVGVSRLVGSRRRFLDRDNLWGGAKPLIDCLVSEQFLPNDREQDIDLQVTQQVSSDRLDWTVVTIDARPLELRTPLEAGA